MKRKNNISGRFPKARPAFWIAAYTLLAGVLDFGHFHLGQQSDSVLPSLVSTMQWTMFYWRNERYGMLFPLLAKPIHHPLANLMFITFLTIAFGMAAYFLLARLIFAPNPWWPLVGGVSLMFMMLLGSRHFMFEFFGPSQFQAPPLAMGCAALWIVEGGRQWWRYLASMVLLLLTAWYNVSTPIILILILGCKVLCCEWQSCIARRDWKRVVFYKNGSFILLGSSFLGGWLLLKQSRYAVLDLGATVPIGELPQAWRGFWRDSVRGFTDGMQLPWFAYGLIALWLAVVIVWLSRRDLRNTTFQPMRSAAAGQLAAVLFTLLVSMQWWVRENGYGYRYVIPAYFMTLIACIGAGMALWFVKHPIRQMERLALVCWVITMTACLYRYGWPNLNNVRRDMASHSSMTTDIVNYNVTHVAGDYWNVWTQVFNANWALYERGQTNQVFGMANRAEDTIELWPKDRDGWRIAVANADQNRLGDLRRWNIGKLSLLAKTKDGFVLKAEN